MSAHLLSTTAPLVETGQNLVALPEVLDRLQICASKFYSLMAEGQFPRPLKIGRSSRWLASDVAAFINRAAAAREAQSAPAAAPRATAHQSAAPIAA